jgi:hypothetical protein
MWEYEMISGYLITNTIMEGVVMRVIVIACLLLCTGVASAEGYQGEIDKFFMLFDQGKKAEAVDSLYASNPWMSSAKDSIREIKDQFAGIENLVGQYNGHALIGESIIKERFVHVTYLALYDRQPVRMEFQFYRPKQKWLIYGFSFDIEFDNAVEAEARSRAAQGK